MDVPPEICFSPTGKPFVANSAHLCFSQARCRLAAVVAVASCRQVGVDIEDRGSLPDLDHLCQSVLHPEEREALRHVTDRAALFLAFWTRKEAAVKAWGVGFRVAPDSVLVLGDRASAVAEEQSLPGLALQDFGTHSLVGAIASEEIPLRIITPSLTHPRL
jgi:phosphopantetheinyl transferase